MTGVSKNVKLYCNVAKGRFFPLFVRFLVFRRRHLLKELNLELYKQTTVGGECPTSQLSFVKRSRLQNLEN